MSSVRALQVFRLKAVPQHVARGASTLAPTAPLPLEPVEQEFRDKYHPSIGNRDIVGFGRNGTYSYLDCTTFPYPALRWEQNTAESQALMEKAKGDWKQLTMEEKKKLYRHSFCQTMSELKAPNSEWKIVWAIVLAYLTATCWMYVFMRNYVYDAMIPSTLTRDHQRAVMERMIDQKQGMVEGIGSTYDWENKRFK